MENYLKDSPSDNNATSTANSQSNNYDQYRYNPQFNDNLNNNFEFNYDQNQEGNNDFSLNLNYTDYNQNNNNNDCNNQQSNFNANNLTTGDYLSPMGFSYSQQQDSNYNTNNQKFSNPGSFNEPFFDDVAFSQAILAPQLSNNPSQSQNSNLSPTLSPQQQPFINPMTTSANLDEIISPNNYDESNSFLNPQYFSPPNNKGNHFKSLNSIAEDTTYQDNFSPEYSRHGSISGPSYNQQQNYNQAQNLQPDIVSGSYLSPQFNPPSFVSSGNRPDSSYLNSPPNYPNPNQNFSSSIPNPPTSIKSEQWNTLSPPPSSGTLSTSVPNQQQSKENIPTKQLSKEEKLKRRREFHNAVERRRRDLIKEKIKELGIIVPPSLLNPQLSAVQSLQRKTQSKNDNSIDLHDLNDIISSVKVKETKPNKSTILNKSVDYVNHLKYVLEQQEIARDKLVRSIDYYEGLLNQKQNQIQQGANNNNNIQMNYNPDDFFADLGTSTDNF
ncbi:unnamed protein product [Candida verbasci]|uniref:BHLH domain-containing protein n=1 Tax=Candida verbasci TaxID=1227364 RepID=A0A9W4TSR9_9ASCO|nr:unnamed protein product [Candida verbasci]